MSDQRGYYAPPAAGYGLYMLVRLKTNRFLEHLDYAAAHGVLADVDRFLRSLPEDEWAHVSDFASGPA